MQCGLNMFGNYLIWLKICIEPQLLPGRRFAQSIKILVLSLVFDQFILHASNILL